MPRRITFIGWCTRTPRAGNSICGDAALWARRSWPLWSSGWHSRSRSAASAAFSCWTSPPPTSTRSMSKAWPDNSTGFQPPENMHICSSLSSAMMKSSSSCWDNILRLGTWWLEMVGARGLARSGGPILKNILCDLADSLLRYFIAYAFLLSFCYIIRKMAAYRTLLCWKLACKWATQALNVEPGEPILKTF